MPRKINTMTGWNEQRPPIALSIRGPSGNFSDKLRDILSDQHKCEAFIDWMYREFSSEAILSFLEFVQFKKFVKQRLGKTDGVNSTGDPDPYDFKLYDGMPKSSIIYDQFRLDQAMVTHSMILPVHEIVPSASEDVEQQNCLSNDPLMRCKRIAHLLFKKYIDNGSEHEINISGRMRDKYAELQREEYDGMNLQQFVSLYDEVIPEMMKYQFQSYQRYERQSK